MEYSNLKIDFIARCLENYKHTYNGVKYEVTQAISTLLIVCVVMISDNKHNKNKSSILRDYKENFDALLVKYPALRTSDSVYMNINNIRNGIAHMIENDFQVVSNDEKQINTIRFKSDKMLDFQEVSISDIHDFLLDLSCLFKVK